MQEITLKINGMMCPHCEANVKKCLEAFPKVAEALPSHTENQAVVKLNAELTTQELGELKQAVTDAGYQIAE
ncbi:MAG: hypothetical protein E7496_01545 [Ruminococcus sp.]|nr:hypothetical protein [Ruminococcus sp.]